jgi:hypothetical protein
MQEWLSAFSLLSPPSLLSSEDKKGQREERREEG